MKKPKLLLAGLALALGLSAVPALAGTAGATPAPPSAGSSQVYVTHGLPLDDHGTKVDVFAGAQGAPVGDAGQLIDDFTFGNTVGPVTLAAANYTVYLAAPSAGDDGKLSPGEIIYQQNLAVPSGQNLSAVASFNASGSPQIAVFSNDVSRTSYFSGRLSIRHAAAAPAVNVDVGLFPFDRIFPRAFTKTFGPASNGQQADAVLPSFLRYDIDVKVASSGAKVAGVEKFKVDSRTLTEVYAVRIPGKNFQFVVAKIKL
jgi:Domain of unknown function (DUF4397)